MTPSVDRLWDTITEGVFKDSSTLQGVGANLPAVDAPKGAAQVPKTAPLHSIKAEPRADEPDALASALTGDSPNPPAVNAIPGATQVMAAVAAPVAVTSGEPSRPTLTSEGALEVAASASRSSSRAKTEPRSVPPVAAAAAVRVTAPLAASGGSAGAWLVKALLAFAVSYAAVSYYKASLAHGTDPSPSPPPASSR